MKTEKEGRVQRLSLVFIFLTAKCGPQFLAPCHSHADFAKTYYLDECIRFHLSPVVNFCEAIDAAVDENRPLEVVVCPQNSCASVSIGRVERVRVVLIGFMSHVALSPLTCDHSLRAGGRMRTMRVCRMKRLTSC